MTFEAAGVDVSAKGKGLVGEEKRAWLGFLKITSPFHLLFLSLVISSQVPLLPRDAQGQHNTALLALSRSPPLFHLPARTSHVHQ